MEQAVSVAGQASAVLRRARAAGVDLDAVTAELEREGVRSFCDSYRELLGCIRGQAGPERPRMGKLRRLFGHWDPWEARRSRGTIVAMSPPDPLHDPVSALVEAAHEFHRTAGTPGSHTAAPDSLAALQEALQALSAAWYRLGADAARGFEHDRGGRLSREQEVRLIGGLHDVAAAFARCARACREGGATVAPVIARQLDDDGSWFARPATERGTVLK